ncbi:MAG: formimidoylglutamate deiminase [Gemmatimonadota bacterium]|jgi:formimidoylglutamate deiminase
MSDLFFETALLPDGWASDVRITVDADGFVVAVDPGARPGGAERVSGIAVPGVPDLHSHAFQRAMVGLTERGSASGDTFWSWRERMYGFLARLKPEHVEAVAAQLFVELLRHGYTAVTEFHYLRNDTDGTPYGDPVEMATRILSAARATGMGLTLLPTLYLAADFGGAPPEVGQRRFVASVDELLSDVATLAARTAEDMNVRVGLALHSLRAVPPPALSDAVAGLDDVDASAPIHIHVAEQLREVEACLAWSGARPVAWLLDHAPVDARWCAVHATHMTGDETVALARSGAVAGLCPTTEANLGDGFFPLVAYQEAGGRWGVGTDAQVSVSPVAELRLLEYGKRLSLKARNVAAGGEDLSTARALLERAWDGGTQASGRPLGRLAPGARADVVVLDPEHPTLVGRSGYDVLDAWIFAGEDTPVRHVMVGGNWVVLDGRHPRQDAVARAHAGVARALSGT